MHEASRRLLKIHLFPYQVLTWAVCIFIVGILLSGFWSPSWSDAWPVFLLLSFGLLSSALINLLLRNTILVFASWLVIFLLLGMADYSYMKTRFCQLSEGRAEVTGVIANNPIRDFKQQQVIVVSDLGSCREVRLLANLPHFPEYNYGEMIKLEGNIVKPGIIEGFDYERYLRPKFVGYLLQNPTKLELVNKKSGLKYSFLSALYVVKNEVEQSISRSISEPEASLGAGILTGMRASISEEMKNDLNNAGLTHLIALSGFNVTIIITSIAFLLIGLVSRRKVFLIGAILIITFIVMTGASASVVRAGTFALLILYGKTMGRKAHQTNILLLTAAAMLIFNPFLLRDDMGFQLSFLAFAGLVYLARPVSFWLERSRLRALPEIVRGPLTETLSAQIAVFPLIAFAFGRISLISPLSNVLVLSLVPVTMLLTFITALAGIIHFLLGNLFGLLAWPLLAYIITVTKYTARLPLAAISAPKYSLGLIILLYLSIIILYLLTLRAMKRLRIR